MAQDTTSAAFLLGKTTPGMPSYVQPSPDGAGSLKETMVSPQALSQPAPQPKSNPLAFANVMSAIEGKVQSNNSLMKQRNLMLKHVYDQPLTEEEKAQLDPSFLNAINSGDRRLVDMNLRLLADEIRGRSNTLDSSVKFLVDSYAKEQDRIERQREEAVNQVLQFASVYGSQAGKALNSLYGPEYVESLKGMGIDLDSFTSLKTLEEIKDGDGSGPDTSGKTIVLDSGEVLSKDEIDFDDPEVVAQLPIGTLAKAVIAGTGSLKDLTPTDKAKVIEDLYAVGFNPHDVVLRKLNGLVELWESVPEGYKGLAQGYIPSRFDKGDAQKFESAKEVLTRVVARLNDVGMLSDQDVASYKRAMPARNDRDLNAVRSKIEGLSVALTGKDKKVDSKTIKMSAPDGTLWNVPKDKVGIFKQNGYKEV